MLQASFLNLLMGSDIHSSEMAKSTDNGESGEFLQLLAEQMGVDPDSKEFEDLISELNLAASLGVESGVDLPPDIAFQLKTIPLDTDEFTTKSEESMLGFDELSSEELLQASENSELNISTNAEKEASLLEGFDTSEEVDKLATDSLALSTELSDSVNSAVETESKPLFDADNSSGNVTPEINSGGQDTSNQNISDSIEPIYDNSEIADTGIPNTESPTLELDSTDPSKESVININVDSVEAAMNGALGESSSVDMISSGEAEALIEEPITVSNQTITDEELITQINEDEIPPSITASASQISQGETASSKLATSESGDTPETFVPIKREGDDAKKESAQLLSSGNTVDEKGDGSGALQEFENKVGKKSEFEISPKGRTEFNQTVMEKMRSSASEPDAELIDSDAENLIHSIKKDSLQQQQTQKQDLVNVSIKQNANTPGFERALGDRILMMANRNVQIAHIRLDPPDLGMLEVKVQVQQEQTQVVMVSSNAQTRELLESAIPRLRAMLEDQGFANIETEIKDQSEYSQQQQSSEQERQGQGVADSEDMEEQVLPTQVTPLGLIDHYV